MGRARAPAQGWGAMMKSKWMLFAVAAVFVAAAFALAVQEGANAARAAAAVQFSAR